ncbi:MAG: UvrB/UvrC motif-containing protein [Candidatus Paceibacterota bacterium]|jgi:excinuclease UvrABC nuclease subunit
MKFQDLQKFKLPDAPGVYFFKRGKDTLYIGKATSLKDRVKSYFSKDLIGMRGPLILDMAFKADKIEWQETDSVLEALILEANLIKKHQPIYNTKEKSDKSFNYVCITKEEFPRVIIKRGKDIQSTPWRRCKIYGPFPNSSQLKEALKIIRRIFPFMDDKSKNNYEFYKQLKLVPENDYYKKNIRNIKLFFEGKKKSILKNLEKEMKAYAKNHEFEKAGQIKKQIFALKHINDVALIKEDSSRLNIDEGASFRIESYDIAHTSGKEMVGVMTVIEDSEVNKSQYRKFNIRQFDSSNDTGALTELLTRRIGHVEWPLPNLIVIDGGKAQLNAANRVLKERGFNIDTVAVVKDEHHKPKEIIGAKGLIFSREKEILLANSESHRFAIGFHREKMRKRIFKK